MFKDYMHIQGRQTGEGGGRLQPPLNFEEKIIGGVGWLPLNLSNYLVMYIYLHRNSKNWTF